MYLKPSAHSTTPTILVKCVRKTASGDMLYAPNAIHVLLHQFVKYERTRR